MDDQLQELGDFGLKLLFRHIVFNYCQKKSGMGKEMVGNSRWGSRHWSALSEKEPLRLTHECVFGVLALESEPNDPRL